MNIRCNLPRQENQPQEPGMGLLTRGRRAHVPQRGGHRRPLHGREQVTPGSIRFASVGRVARFGLLPVKNPT